jgi:hypothetical protein
MEYNFEPDKLAVPKVEECYFHLIHDIVTAIGERITMMADEADPNAKKGEDPRDVEAMRVFSISLIPEAESLLKGCGFVDGVCRGHSVLIGDERMFDVLCDKIQGRYIESLCDELVKVGLVDMSVDRDGKPVYFVNEEVKRKLDKEDKGNE